MLGVVLTLALLALPVTAGAGPWVPAPRTGYAKFWARWLLGHGFSDGQGERIDGPGYHELTFNTYTEFGLVRGLAALVHWPLLQTFFLEDPAEGQVHAHAHPGDPALGLRYNFWRRGGFALGAEGSVRFPIAPDGPVQDVLSPKSGNPLMGQLRVGSGVWDVYAGLSVGYSARSLYLAAAAGYIVRSGGFDHDLLWSAEFGGAFAQRWSARLRLTGLHPLDVGDPDVPRHESPSGIGNGTSYVGLAAEGEYRFTERWSVGLSLEGGMAAVQRQSRGPVFSLYFATLY